MSNHSQTLQEKKTRKKAEIQAGDNAEELDEQNGRKILALFEKRLRKNQELRIKHAKKPEKFMRSEIELHDMIQGTFFLFTVEKQSYILLIRWWSNFLQIFFKRKSIKNFISSLIFS